jgi:hypothetical protein
MYGPNPMRKADCRDRVIRLRSCIRPLTQGEQCSGPSWKSAHFLHITPTACDGLDPSKVWKMPVRPVHHHLTDNLRNLWQVFSRRADQAAPSEALASKLVFHLDRG